MAPSEHAPGPGTHRPLASGDAAPEVLTPRTRSIVDAAKLHRTATRRKTGRFLAEGDNAVTAALAQGCVHTLFITPAAAERRSDLVAAAQAQEPAVPVRYVNDAAAKALSESMTPPGLVALCSSRTTTVDAALAGSLVAMPVDLSEPGNAGTLIRVADACGAGGVVFAGASVDPEGGKAVRASAGSLFHLPVARCPSASEAFEAARARGYTLLATVMDGDVDVADLLDAAARPASTAEPGGPVLLGNVVWMFGNEAHGLGEWADYADLRVSIPMYGRAESFNVAAAAAICLHNSARIQHARR